MNESIAEPEVCPACNESWNASGQCARCGILLSDVIALIGHGCNAFVQAREAARIGQFGEAHEYLARVRACGIPAVYKHPVVKRLTELCAAALGDTGAQIQIIAGEERAARSAMARGDFRTAAFYAGRAAAAMPGALTLQKLYLLALYGAGRMQEAAQLRRELRHAAPADADLVRWQMPELDAVDRQPARQISSPSNPRNTILAATAGCIFGVVSLLLITGKQMNQQNGAKRGIR